MIYVLNALAKPRARFAAASEQRPSTGFRALMVEHHCHPGFLCHWEHLVLEDHVGELELTTFGQICTFAAMFIDVSLQSFVYHVQRFVTW